jgi:hypothetical protein
MEINDAKDLIASKVTRSKKIDLNSIIALPLNKGGISAMKKQKQIQNDNELLFDNDYTKGRGRVGG